MLSQGLDPQSETGCSVRDRITSQGLDPEAGTGSRCRDWILSQGQDHESGTGSSVKDRTITLEVSAHPRADPPLSHLPWVLPLPSTPWPSPQAVLGCEGSPAALQGG